ncbi:hypothetical protein LUZ61_002896 [Rhynchospora tenuis]|uniref:Protein kinase domain-containing protein n=1 Tax=Rhynchospora tenuis TaxID=198213 RepID=A0AAD6ES94_9POAL|nr:hypothetical protein LUZ61_002896 [Rhynchospora tenuis]
MYYKCYLTDDEKREDLNWERRFKIIEGISRGLSYLHKRHNSKSVVVHRDLKPANILLDADYNPKIADFGLSKVFETEDTHQISQKGAGTPGYIPPELNDGQYSPKSDVYSYGMIVLEILAGCTLGRFKREHRKKLSHVMWEQWKNKWPLIDIIDYSLQEDFEEHEEEIERCYRIGLLCVQENPKKRPDMEHVLVLLRNDDSLSTPSYPGFYPENKRSLDSTSDTENSDTIESDSGPEDASNPELQPLFITEYSPEDLNIITENFSILDENRFQYMGSLDGQTVAVEETNMGSDILALEHPNIINILAYCSEVEQKYFIIYEYPTNGHLADYLNGQDQTRPEHLEWGTRVKIIKGVARGISFLHHVFEDGYIIHGDLNPSKIYLDNSWNAKLCGFGSANVLDEDQDFFEFSEYETLQFIPPEVAAYGWYSKKSDVYNYGKILLQILVNTSVVDRAFFSKVWKKWEQDEILELLDPKLNQCPDEEAQRYFQIALLCVQYEPEKRPSMPEVLKMLNSDEPLPPPFNPIPSSSHATRLPEM